MKIGRFEVFPLSDGTFRLDGGAMFGTVPKTLWSRCCHADESNRIPLSLGVLLIKTPTGKNVLVDAGLSSKYDKNEKFKKIYAVDRSRNLRDELKDHGLDAKDVDAVINTHLHFDHAGGDTDYDSEGKLRPAFPNARYLIQRDEWDDANAPHERNSASYLSESFEPLLDAKSLELVEGEYQVEPGLKVIRSGGHTRGHQCVLIESEGRSAIFLGDLIPTTAHVPLPWIMGYDLYPVDTLESKRALLSRAAQNDWLLIFQHDVERRSAKVAMADGRFAAKLEQPA